VDAVSDETVRRVLKNPLKPWLRQQWSIPPRASGEFVARMDVYHRHFDEPRPQVCIDERTRSREPDFRGAAEIASGLVRRLHDRHVQPSTRQAPHLNQFAGLQVLDRQASRLRRNARLLCLAQTKMHGIALNNAALEPDQADGQSLTRRLHHLEQSRPRKGGTLRSDMANAVADAGQRLRVSGGRDGERKRFDEDVDQQGPARRPQLTVTWMTV
jgi:hypothetical protein